VRDIIEKLKAKKNEKEDFVCLVKEAEEQSKNKRENHKKKDIIEEGKIKT
jgi:hypothetical protein